MTPTQHEAAQLLGGIALLLRDVVIGLVWTVYLVAVVLVAIWVVGRGLRWLAQR